MSARLPLIRRYATAAVVVLLLLQARAAAQVPKDDSAKANPLRGLIAIGAACPDGKRTDKQQTECKRAIDSIQAARKREIERVRGEVAVNMSRALLTDSSFSADDDGRPIPHGRWVHIGSVNSDEQGKRAALEMNIGRADAGTLIVAVLWTGMSAQVGGAVRIDCQRREGQVVRFMVDPGIDLGENAGIGPWYQGTKQHTVIQALVTRTCG